jgi:peroxiredoxin
MKNKSLTVAFATMITVVSIFLISAIPAESGYNVGDKVTDFNLKGIDGKNFSLASLKNNKGAIVIFTCNHCPFSVAYEDRIIALNNKYASQGFPVVAINPNDAARVPEDSFENMVIRAKEKKFTFPYLTDPSQQTAKMFGAARTPHVFILSRNKSTYTVEYIGAIDDNTDEPELVTKKYVESAVDDLLNGKKVATSFTKAIGCTIKWKS